MDTTVQLDELLNAYEWVSTGDAAALGCEAYINRATGEIHWVGEGIDEEAPNDIDDESRYIAVPGKREFDLGRPLVMRFVEEHLPDSIDAVYGFFRKCGAYRQFIALLDRVGQLDAWHAYEQQATEDALRDWCEENGLTLVS